MELNWTNVDTVIKDCILNDKLDGNILMGVDLNDRDTAITSLTANGAKVVETAMQLVAFNVERLEARRDDIKSMLSQLSDDFKRTGGGGMSLMNMVATADGTLWGEQWQADMLFALGAGVGLASFVVPREQWSMLPGSMPYIVLDL